jgi:hypothetical protein
MARISSSNAADPFRLFGVVFQVRADLTVPIVISVRAATTTGRPALPKKLPKASQYLIHDSV